MISPAAGVQGSQVGLIQTRVETFSTWKNFFQLSAPVLCRQVPYGSRQGFLIAPGFKKRHHGRQPVFRLGAGAAVILYDGEVAVGIEPGSTRVIPALDASVIIQFRKAAGCFQTRGVEQGQGGRLHSGFFFFPPLNFERS